MSDPSSTKSSGSKKPGVKSERLSVFFGNLFQGVECDVTNSIDLFNPAGKSMCRRAVCYSLGSFKLSSYKELGLSGGVFEREKTWGVFGKDATTANIANDKVFVLGCKNDKHYDAKVLIRTDANLNVISIDTDEDHITETLVEMQLISKRNYEMRIERKNSQTPSRRGRKKKNPPPSDEPSPAEGLCVDALGRTPYASSPDETELLNLPPTAADHDTPSYLLDDLMFAADYPYGGFYDELNEKPAGPPLKYSRSCPDRCNQVDSDEGHATQMRGQELVDSGTSLANFTFEAPPSPLQNVGIDPKVIGGSEENFVLCNQPGPDDFFWRGMTTDDESNPLF